MPQPLHQNPLFLATLWLSLSACADGSTTPIDTGTVSAVSVADADEDGYDETEDCDDSDSGVSPGATELCDGVDNDCDGLIDEDDAADASTWYADQDGDGFGDGEIARNACQQPSGYLADDGDCDDDDAATRPGAEEICGDGIDNDCDGNAALCVVEHCGNIDADETWSADDIHLITCNVFVQGSSAPVLSVDDGASLLFDPDTSLLVGHGDRGSLRVAGSVLGVTMTSSQGLPAPGDWDQLYIGSQDQGSVLEGLTVRYGGSSGQGLVHVADAEPTFADCTVGSSASAGFFVSGAAAPAISGTRVSDNAEIGVYIGSEASLSTADEPSFTDNVLTGNGEHALELPADSLDQLDASSSFIGNGVDRVVVTTDTVDDDGTWQALDVGVRMRGNIYIEGSSQPRITIDGGATFYMDSASLLVGHGDPGLLTAQGGSDPITFTSEHALPGDWDQLHFGSQDQGSVLEGVTAEYGGASGNGLVYLTGSEPMLMDCTVRESASEGVFISSAAYPTITGTTVADNAEVGVYIGLDGGLSTASEPSFTDNVLTGSGEYPMTIPADFLDQLDASSTFSGNALDQIRVTSDTVDDDGIWQALDVAFRMEGNVFVQGSARPVVTVEAGTTFVFDTFAYLLVGYSDHGSLTALGTEGAPITFSSAAAVPAPGDWGGLFFGRYCADAASELDHVTVSHAGASLGNVELDSCDLTLSNATIAASASWGIYRSSSSPVLTAITYSDNASGDLY